MFGKPDETPITDPQAEDFMPEPVFNDKLVENAEKVKSQVPETIKTSD